jgi:putative transposase
MGSVTTDYHSCLRKGLAMPRKPRFYIPDIPCHVIQRGNNRDPCFFSEENYHFYLENLKSACSMHHVAVHAYVLMTNHVHLLMTPETTEGISSVMQSLGRRYVQHINQAYGRSGTLWEGRHKSCPVDAESYLLACYRYIESNPVVARMVDHPGAYPWSSYRANAYGEADELITPHPLYLQLGLSAPVRQTNYRELFSASSGKDEIHAIQTASQFSTPLGSDHFRKQIERLSGHKAGQSKRGRSARITTGESGK